MVPICRTETQMQIQRTGAWALAGGRRGWGNLRGQRCACAPARVTRPAARGRRTAPGAPTRREGGSRGRRCLSTQQPIHLSAQQKLNNVVRTYTPIKKFTTVNKESFFTVIHIVCKTKQGN